MFTLHETTRKRICRTAFFALCVAPALATAAWIGHARRPWRAADEARWLGAALHARTTLAGYETPRPGAARSSQLTLSDAATGRKLLSLKSWECRERGDVRTITAAAATVAVADFAALTGKIASWLAELSVESMNVRIERLTVEWPLASTDSTSAQLLEFELYDVQARVEADGSNGWRLQATARATADEESENSLVRLAASRTAGAASPVTLTVDNSSTPAPVPLVSTVLACANGLGADATFAGELQLEIAGASMQGAGQGRLDHAELAALLPAGSPHQLSGQANVELQRLRWHGDRLLEFAGSLHAVNATASRSLIAAAVDRLFCGQIGAGVPATTGAESTTETDPAQTLIALDTLACQFAWDSTGLTFAGKNPAAENNFGGELATSGGQVFLYGPRCSQLSVGHWLQFVTGPAANWLPATRESVDVAARLPLPE